MVQIGSENLVIDCHRTNQPIYKQICYFTLRHRNMIIAESFKIFSQSMYMVNILYILSDVGGIWYPKACMYFLRIKT
jgi:hypothetical protein